MYRTHLAVILLLLPVVALTQNTTSSQQVNSTTPTPSSQGHRPSIWSRTVHHMQQNRRRSPYSGRPYLRRSTEMRPVESASDEESKLLDSPAIVGLKDFANQLVNETAALFKAAPQPRAYPGTEPVAEDVSQQQTQQFWDDKDQAYHASSYSGLDYEPPTGFHHPYPHPPVHYYPVPHKKDDTLFTKVALLALLKLILAKLKTIGFLKIFLIFMLKVPILFFKMLIAFKGFKFLKLLSIPFLIAAFALPFLPLIPLLFFTFLPFLFLIPLGIPLLLPLLLFLPIIPVTAQPTAAAQRTKRSLDLPQTLNGNSTWTILDEQWKDGRKKRMFKTRSRPVSKDAARRVGISRYEPFFNEEQPNNLFEITQRVIQSQHCMERAACEIAAYNDSKLYQSAIIWALGKIQTFAPADVQRRIEQYSQAYENGIHRRSGDFCAQRFQCNRPKIMLVQGAQSYNVL